MAVAVTEAANGSAAAHTRIHRHAHTEPLDTPFLRGTHLFEGGR